MTVPAEEQTVDRHRKQRAGDRCDAFNDQRAQRDVSSWWWPKPELKERMTYIHQADGTPNDW